MSEATLTPDEALTQDPGKRKNIVRRAVDAVTDKAREIYDDGARKAKIAEYDMMLTLGERLVKMALNIFPKIRTECASRGILVDDVVNNTFIAMRSALTDSGADTAQIGVYFKSILMENLVPVFLNEFLPSMQKRMRAYLALSDDQTVSVVTRMQQFTDDDGTPIQFPVLYLMADNPTVSSFDQMVYKQHFTTDNIADIFLQKKDTPAPPVEDAEMGHIEGPTEDEVSTGYAYVETEWEPAPLTDSVLTTASDEMDTEDTDTDTDPEAVFDTVEGQVEITYHETVVAADSE